MRDQERIDELFAFVVIDTDGTEGVPAIRQGPLTMPLMGADTSRMSSLVAPAQDVADELGRPVEMVRYGRREHVRWLQPRAKIDLCINCAKPVLHGEGVTGAAAPQHIECPSPPAEPGRAPFEQFDKPHLVDTETTIQAQGVIVGGRIVDGAPAIQVTYVVGDRTLPGMTVSGQVAEDLVKLATDALAVAKQSQQ